MINIGINDDYACTWNPGENSWEEDHSKVSFYYGYEEELEGEWDFVAKKDRQVLVKYSASDLEGKTERILDEPLEYLLVGISVYLNEVA